MTLAGWTTAFTHVASGYFSCISLNVTSRPFLNVVLIVVIIYRVKAPPGENLVLVWDDEEFSMVSYPFLDWST